MSADPSTRQIQLHQSAVFEVDVIAPYAVAVRGPDSSRRCQQAPPIARG
jgi:hypothetical protein